MSEEKTETQCYHVISKDVLFQKHKSSQFGHIHRIVIKHNGMSDAKILIINHVIK